MMIFPSQKTKLPESLGKVYIYFFFGKGKWTHDLLLARLVLCTELYPQLHSPSDSNWKYLCISAMYLFLEVSPWFYHTVTVLDFFIFLIIQSGIEYEPNIKIYSVVNEVFIFHFLYSIIFIIIKYNVYHELIHFKKKETGLLL